MYDSLKIRGFRAFDQFEIGDLTRVNLLVGKNNSGKTSLLDAVEMVALGGRVVSLMRSPRRRNEVSLESVEDRTRRDLDIRHLFFGHHMQEGAAFEITALQGTATRAVRCELRRSHTDTLPFDDDVQRDPLSEPSEFFLPLELMIRGSDNPEGTPILPLSANGSVLEYPRSAPALPAAPIVLFLGTEGPADSMQQMWDQIVLTPEEDKIVAAMKVIEPAIERLAFTAPMRLSQNSIAYVKLSGADGRIPLGSLGDGTKRLLAQALYSSIM